MPLRQLLAIALRQTLDPGDGLSGFLSRISIVGLVLAVALLLAVMSVMNGFEQEMRGRILGLVPHVTVRGVTIEAEWSQLQRRLTREPAFAAVRGFHDTDALVVRGREAAAIRLLGLEGDLSQFQAMLEPNLPRLSPGELALGIALREQLNLKVGDRVTLIAPGASSGADVGAVLRLTLAAVIDTGTELDQQLALSTPSDVAALVDVPQRINGLAIKLVDLFDASSWRRQLSQSLSARFWVTDWTASHGNLYSAIELSRSLILMLMASIIAVAAFNVVSSLILVVTDRAQSIAMLRAMGAKQSDVVLVFLAQGGLIGLLGGLGGSVAGALLSAAAPTLAELLGAWMGRPLLSTDVYPIGFLPLAMRAGDFVLVSVIALLLCLVASAIPAWRAARLSVVDTLAR